MPPALVSAPRLVPAPGPGPAPEPGLGLGRISLALLAAAEAEEEVEAEEVLVCEKVVVVGSGSTLEFVCCCWTLQQHQSSRDFKHD